MKNVERYELVRSPLAQRPTQRDVASLLGETRDNLRRLVNYKEQFIVRRSILSGKFNKKRGLAYPVGRLRSIHEKLKFHLSKVKQPPYLFSPRRGMSTRANAGHHLSQDHYLTLDIKKFYPSTSRIMVREWFQDELGMEADVAGLLAHICTVDDVVSFGSPLTPVLCSLIHRRMFDEIYALCNRKGLRFSVWVDDITVSGRFLTRELLDEIRVIVRGCGLRSHKIKFKTGNRPVFITGIGVVGRRLVIPNTFNLDIKELWHSYESSVTDDGKDDACQRLLSKLGTVRFVSGKKSARGRRVADQMNTLRQQRDARQRKREAAYIEKQKSFLTSFPAPSSNDEVPWDCGVSKPADHYRGFDHWIRRVWDRTNQSAYTIRSSMKQVIRMCLASARRL